MICTDRIDYASLNARQKESYNAAKLASALADFGYTCVRLHDDYETGDLLALRPGEVHNIQLKGRLTIAQKYAGKGLLLAFPYPSGGPNAEWYVVPHDRMLEIAREHTTALLSKDWTENGTYSWPRPSRAMLALIEEFRIVGVGATG